MRKNGVTLFGAKDEIIKLLGKADMYFFSPEHPPLTTSAQKALNWAIDTKNRPGNCSLLQIFKSPVEYQGSHYQISYTCAKFRVKGLKFWFWALTINTIHGPIHRGV